MSACLLSIRDIDEPQHDFLTSHCQGTFSQETVETSSVMNRSSMHRNTLSCEKAYSKLLFPSQKSAAKLDLKCIILL